MNLLQFLSARLPLYSRNARDAAWLTGYEAGKKLAKLTRAPNGQYKSLRARRNMGVTHLSEKDAQYLKRVEFV